MFVVNDIFHSPGQQLIDGCQYDTTRKLILCSKKLGHYDTFCSPGLNVSL